MVTLRVRKKYNDLERNQLMTIGMDFEVTVERARLLMEKGFVDIIKIEKVV